LWLKFDPNAEVVRLAIISVISHCDVYERCDIDNFFP
jgi:hypothetical protein